MPATGTCPLRYPEIPHENFRPAAFHRRRHPAILVAIIVHRNALPNLPADGHQFVEVRFVDRVARVVLPVPAQIGRETGFFDGHLPEQGKDLLRFIEGRCGKRAKFPDQVVDGDPRRCFQLIHGCIRQTIEYTVCGTERSCPGPAGPADSVVNSSTTKDTESHKGANPRGFPSCSLCPSWLIRTLPSGALRVKFSGVERRGGDCLEDFEQLRGIRGWRRRLAGHPTVWNEMGSSAI